MRSHLSQNVVKSLEWSISCSHWGTTKNAPARINNGIGSSNQTPVQNVGGITPSESSDNNIIVSKKVYRTDGN